MKTTRATSTAVAKKSSTKASQLLWPIQGMWKSRSNSEPYASRIVVSKTVKPHMVKKCARPGTVQLQQLALTRDLDEFGVGDLANSLPTPRRGLARANQPREPEEAAARDGKTDHRDGEADEDSR